MTGVYVHQTPIEGLTVADANPTGQRAANVQDVAIKSVTYLSAYERWLEFHQTHPKVYRSLEGLALYAIRQNPPRRFGVKALYEIARWEKRLGFKKEVGEEWKLPNEYTAMYARLLAEIHPEFLGNKEQGIDPYFEMRQLRSGVWPTDADSVAARRPSDG